MASIEDTSNFFKRVDFNEECWNNYLAARPQYDQPFYQSIYDYHQSHYGFSEMAHDVATGPGQVAAELSNHFSRVIASDINSTHLAVADAHPPCSVDLIAAAECLPLIDATRATQSFSTVLRPNGTLAIWF